MEKARKAAFVPIWIIIGNIFHSFYSRLTPWKTSLPECWRRHKKSCFYLPFWYKERQERGNHKPLVSLRRPGSAEQATFQRFLVKRRQARGDRKVRVTLEKRSEKKDTKKQLYPYAHQDRETTKDILRIVNS